MLEHNLLQSKSFEHHDEEAGAMVIHGTQGKERIRKRSLPLKLQKHCMRFMESDIHAKGLAH